MKLNRIVLRRTTKHFREEVIISIPGKNVPTSQTKWAEVASYLHQLMIDGFVPSYQGGVEEGGLVNKAYNPETDEL